MAPNRQHKMPMMEGDQMPGGKTPGPSVKKPNVYEALRKKGMTKKKAAMISNAMAK